MERFFYTFSTLHCLAVSMQNGGVGTGTLIRPDTLRRYAADAGFSTVEALDVEHPQFVLYRLAGDVTREGKAERGSTVLVASRFLTSP